MAYTPLVILHLAFIAMGTGLSLSNLVNLRLARSHGAEVAPGLALQRRTVARIGDGVIAAIWLSGLALLWAGGQGFSGWLGVKLAFVVLLTLCHGLARRTAGEIMRSGNKALLPRLEMFVAGVFLSALAAIVLAVLAFRSPA